MIDAATLTVVGGMIGTTILGIGGLGKFVWSKIERRFEAIEQQLAQCEERERTGAITDARKLTVIELLWIEIVRISPDGINNPTLTRVGRILDELKVPMPFSYELDRLARSIDRRNAP